MSTASSHTEASVEARAVSSAPTCAESGPWRASCRDQRGGRGARIFGM
ncbi:MAG: hypothetical protein IPO73_12440 [Gemmatimonadetes bacterium]|nr:hypothetical protein [Gemmatimonadota bacterium]